jgi:hypothetical protein
MVTTFLNQHLGIVYFATCETVLQAGPVTDLSKAKPVLFGNRPHIGSVQNIFSLEQITESYMM